MNVAIDATPLRLTRAGTARYLESLLSRLDLQPISFGGPGRASVLARELWWYPVRLSLLRDVDLLHCPTYYGPLRPRVPTVVTVHDLAALRRPEWFPAWTRTYAPRIAPRVIRAAWAYFAPCIRRVRGCTHCGWCSGTRSCTIVDRSPPRCGGYIQSLK